MRYDAKNIQTLNFINDVKNSKTVWGLSNEKGWANSPSNEYEDTLVYPFWSSKESSMKLAINEWGTYLPTPIDVDEFIDSWLKGLHNNHHLVGLNWNENLEGEELEPIHVGQLLINE